MQQLRATTKSLTCLPLSIARYSFIQLSQQGRQRRERNCPIFDTVAKQDSNPGSLGCESGILPLSYRAPHNPGPAGVFPFHAERVASQSPQSGHERAQLLRNFLSRLLEVSNRHLDPIRRHEASIESLDDSVATLNPGLAALLSLVEPTFGLARYLQAQLHGPILLVEPILHIICHVGPNNEFTVALKCQPARRAQLFP